MNLLKVIAEGIEKGRGMWRDISCEEYELFLERGEVSSADDSMCSMLGAGDGVRFMAQLAASGYREKFQFIYIDPPFCSRTSYNTTLSVQDRDGRKHRILMDAYDDRWKGAGEYVAYMACMLEGIRELLAPSGTVAVHIDWHAGHYLRAAMDEIFGYRNFINEIIWTYKSGGSGKRHFSRKHDNIYVYGKTSDHHFNMEKVKSYNRGFRKYSFRGVSEYQDETGWYTLVNEKDVWHIDMVGRTSSERTGYATQKPRVLLEKLIRAFSDKGDLVGDFCAGSGTTMKAAESLGRKWVCCDINPAAVTTMLNHLGTHGCDTDFICCMDGDMKEKICRAEMVYRTEKEGDRCYLVPEWYSAPVPDEKFPEKSLKMVKRIMRECPERLISFVSLDENYNGREHRSSRTFGRCDLRKGRIEVGSGRLHVITGDVLGNFSQKEIMVI